MKKELLISIFFGLCAGLIVTYGVYRLFLRANPSGSTVPQVSPAANADPIPESANLAINTPFEGQIQTETKLMVSGSTKANSTLVITTPTDEFFTTADTSGNFAQSVALESGVNIIGIHAFDETGTQSTIERTVVVTDVSEPVKTASASATASPSASPRATARPTATPKPSPTP